MYYQISYRAVSNIFWSTASHPPSASFSSITFILLLLLILLFLLKKKLASNIMSFFLIGYPSHRAYHPLIVGALPLLIKPILRPPSCFPSLSSCNHFSFSNHPNPPNLS